MIIMVLPPFKTTMRVKKMISYRIMVIIKATRTKASNVKKRRTRFTPSHLKVVLAETDT